MGVGGQIGAELTDFVFILNDKAAVRTFSEAGSLHLGGNVSIAAGPVGRNAEAAGSASMKGFAGVFSYSKTKGLFAGVSLEGSVLVERRDANEKLYRQRVKARDILTGALPPPAAADPLLRVLNSRAFTATGGQFNDDAMYNDIPVYDDTHDDVVWEGRRGSGFNEGVQRDRTGSTAGRGNDTDYNKPQRASTWNDDVYDPPSRGSPRTDRFEAPRRTNTTGSGGGFGDNDFMGANRTGRSSTIGSNGPGPGRPLAPKPTFGAKKAEGLDGNKAIALFTFEADQAGDLGFKKGDIITITKKTDSKNDWWTGTLNGKSGMFPSNYVDAI
jgi:SH3 domain-containing YSC84-like protein 1